MFDPFLGPEAGACARGVADPARELVGEAAGGSGNAEGAVLIEHDAADGALREVYLPIPRTRILGPESRIVSLVLVLLLLMMKKGRRRKAPPMFLPPPPGPEILLRHRLQAPCLP